MKPAPCGAPDARPSRPGPVASGAAGWLAFAAAPVFGLMALLEGIAGADPAAVLCSQAGLSHSGGMATMYLLMSVFHAAPWLGLTQARRAASARRS